MIEGLVSSASLFLSMPYIEGVIVAIVPHEFKKITKIFMNIQM